MAGLITVEQLEARLKVALTGDAATQASSLIDDASDIVRLVARTDFATSVPGVVVAVVAQMVRRALENPDELTGETVGAYGWQAMGKQSTSAGGALYVTRAERKLIREAAGRPAVIGIAMDTGLGDPYAEVAE